MRHQVPVREFRPGDPVFSRMHGAGIVCGESPEQDHDPHPLHVMFDDHTVFRFDRQGRLQYGGAADLRLTLMFEDPTGDRFQLGDRVWSSCYSEPGLVTRVDENYVYATFNGNQHAYTYDGVRFGETARSLFFSKAQVSGGVARQCLPGHYMLRTNSGTETMLLTADGWCLVPGQIPPRSVNMLGAVDRTKQ